MFRRHAVWRKIHGWSWPRSFVSEGEGRSRGPVLLPTWKELLREIRTRLRRIDRIKNKSYRHQLIDLSTNFPSPVSCGSQTSDVSSCLIQGSERLNRRGDP